MAKDSPKAQYSAHGQIKTAGDAGATCRQIATLPPLSAHEIHAGLWGRNRE
jgi:hypothetical protein